jgi:glucoamylase
LTLPAPALVHWSFDDWRTALDGETKDTGLGIYVVDLPAATLGAGARIVFTIFWLQERRWEGSDYAVMVEKS